MKRIVALVMLLTVAVSVPSIVLAVFTSKTLVGKTASVNFDADPTGDMTVLLKNVTGDTEATTIGWDVTLPYNGWKASEQYIDVTNTYNGKGWGIQIYTDNTDPVAIPRFTGNTEVVNPAGLLKVGDPNSGGLPLCWRITDNTTNTLAINETPENHLYNPILNPNPYTIANPLGTEYWNFFWMKDKFTADIPTANTDKFVPGEDYVTVWNEKGIHFAEGPADFGSIGDGNAKIYLGAKFSGATTPNTYSTNRLFVELFYM